MFLEFALLICTAPGVAFPQGFYQLLNSQCSTITGSFQGLCPWVPRIKACTIHPSGRIERGSLGEGIKWRTCGLCQIESGGSCGSSGTAQVVWLRQIVAWICFLGFLRSLFPPSFFLRWIFILFPFPPNQRLNLKGEGSDLYFFLLGNTFPCSLNQFLCSLCRFLIEGLELVYKILWMLVCVCICFSQA